MNYQQLDKIADLCNPILAVVVIVLAIVWLKNAAAPFLLRNGLAAVIVQQTSKFIQKHAHLGPRFPSTHFAFSLTLAIALVFLRPRLWPVAVGYLVLYGALMLFQHYHTPREMLGALFAVPIALLFNWKFSSKQPISAN